MLRLLCITAHPDDESGSFGGTLFLAHKRGVETYVVCLTPGEAATHRAGAAARSELAAMRRQEFAKACKVLNVTHGEVLDYPDGKLDRQDFFAVTGELTRRIRTLRPHVVITYGSEGSITAHVDHGMAGLFATMAFQSAPRDRRYPEQFSDGLRPWRPQKLYYPSSDFTLQERQPVALPPASALINIGDEGLARKIEAFHQHRSQEPLFSLFERHVCQHGTYERYHLAAASTPRDAEMETDLFAGVVDEE